MRPGDIFRDSEFYIAPSGEIKAKYLLVLAAQEASDLVIRLLTSRAHGRPEIPPCFHGMPYAGYFLGVPGGALSMKTWVDLRYQDDLDTDDFHKRQRKGLITHALSLRVDVLRPVLECVAGADDTTRQQERLLRNTLTTLR